MRARDWHIRQEHGRNRLSLAHGKTKAPPVDKARQLIREKDDHF
jgi:hypothetical protein